MRHVQRHPEPVPGCFGCKVLSVETAVASPPAARPVAPAQPPYELHTRTARASRDPELRRRLAGEFS